MSADTDRAPPRGSAAPGRATLDVRSRQGWSIAAAAAVLAVLAGSLGAMPRHVFWSPDEGGKFFALSSIGWNGGITVAAPYLGRGIDPDLRFYPRGRYQPRSAFPYPVTAADSSVRFHWPLWFPLASRPLFAAFGITGIYLLPLLSGWLMAVISGRIAGALAPRLAPATIVIVGWATPVWFYSLTFWEHTLAACAGMLALAVLVSAQAADDAVPASPGGWGAPIAIIASLFVAVLLRIEMMAFAAAALVIWAQAARAERGRAAAPGAEAGLRRKVDQHRRTVAIAALAALVGGLLWLAAVSALAPRQADLITSAPRRIGEGLWNLSALPRSAVSILISSARDEGPMVAPAWLGAAGLAVALCGLAPFLRRAWVEACVVLPALAIMLAFSLRLLTLGQGYRALHGFFPGAPFTIVWLYALAGAPPGAWRLRTLARFALYYGGIAYAALFVFRGHRAGDIGGGLEWGARYLLALYPVLAVLAVAGMDSYARSNRPAWLRAAVTGLTACLAVAALYSEIRGVGMLRANRELLATWDRALQSERPIVTDVWWLPAALAPQFATKATYFVRGPRELRDWRALAAAHGETGFTLATLRPPSGAAGPGLCQAAERSRVVAGLHLVRYERCAAVGVGGQ